MCMQHPGFGRGSWGTGSVLANLECFWEPAWFGCHAGGHWQQMPSARASYSTKEDAVQQTDTRGAGDRRSWEEAWVNSLTGKSHHKPRENTSLKRLEIPQKLYPGQLVKVFPCMKLDCKEGRDGCLTKAQNSTKIGRHMKKYLICSDRRNKIPF